MGKMRSAIFDLYIQYIHIQYILVFNLYKW